MTPAVAPIAGRSNLLRGDLRPALPGAYVRTVEDLYRNLEHSSTRVRRLLCVAFYDFVKGYSPSAAYDDIVVLAKARLDDGDQSSVCRRLEPEAPGLPADAELAVELARMCSWRVVDYQQLCSAVWAVRGMMSETDKALELEILECLDLVGWGITRRSHSEYYPPHVVGIAQQVYEGDRDAIPVLADAMEEIGIGEDHLRAPGRHWKGCWVVDNILRRS